MAVSKKILYSIPLIFLAALGAALVLTGGDLTITFSGVSSAASSPSPSGGDFSLISSAGDSAGAIASSGGDFSITGEVPGGSTTGTAFLKTNLSEIIVFPNPYRPGSGGAYDASNITFRNLTQKVKIRIFNIAAELVKTIDYDGQTGQLAWDARNDDGQKVASGVYIYIASNPDDTSQKAKGKFAIIK